MPIHNLRPKLMTALAVLAALAALVASAALTRAVFQTITVTTQPAVSLPARSHAIAARSPRAAFRPERMFVLADDTAPAPPPPLSPYGGSGVKG